MSAIGDLQNLAAKIEELKDKLSDEEYKDLLELSHKYYDKEKQKEEKRKPKIFVHILEITPICYYTTSGDCDLENNELGCCDNDEFLIGMDDGADSIENFRVHVRPAFKKEKKMLEVVDDFHTNEFQIRKCEYERLKHKIYAQENPRLLRFYLGEKIIK
tara:strand:- start:49 stop:525 length:477 start_codon:yes stop_codon:yes gene_type:complete